jgi:DNA-binding FadR family transcriptional regulator
MNLSLEPVSTQRAYEAVVEQLRQQIATGKIRPGDRLPSERDLAAMLKVSRNTVREAMRTLELSGLIQLRTGGDRGAYVIRGTSSAIVNGMRDLYFLGAITPEALMEARRAVGASVVRIATPRLTDVAVEALEQNVAAADEAGASGAYDSQAAIHREFHVLLAKATGNFILIAMMEGLMDVVEQMVRTMGPTGEHDNYTSQSRRKLLQHLKRRDAQAAEKEYVGALEGLWSRYQQRLAAQAATAAAVPAASKSSVPAASKTAPAKAAPARKTASRPRRSA